jgi:hypothetical protein
LRGRRGPIDIWCVPAPERLALYTHKVVPRAGVEPA